MSHMSPRPPPFVFGYWRPWNADANAFESYLDYVKDASLAKYGADTVGKYIAQASREHVAAIDKVSRAIGHGFGTVSNQLSAIDGSLRFLNRNMDMQIEQQRLSNLLLHNIAELLRVPDSEKERQHTIELGVKFLVNGSKDPDLYADALEMLLKAETMMKQDYFVLHRIGCIYLHVEKYLDPAKALDYFTRAAKYASVESDPKAARLASVLAARPNAPNAEITESPSAIRSLAAESYENAAFAAYVVGDCDQAVALQSKAVRFAPVARNHFKLSKYQVRNRSVQEGVVNLEKALDDTPLLVAAVLRDIDLLNEPEVLRLIENKPAATRLCRIVADVSAKGFIDLFLKLALKACREIKQRIPQYKDTARIAEALATLIASDSEDKVQAAIEVLGRAQRQVALFQMNDLTFSALQNKITIFQALAEDPESSSLIERDTMALEQLAFVGQLVKELYDAEDGSEVAAAS